MTEQNRTPDRGQIGLYALVGLAVLATIIMLFTDSGAWLKIALIAALWAAAVGFFLVYRSRKEKNEAEIQLQAAQQAHDAELKAVEASAEKDRKALELSQNQDGLSTADAELLKEIREELALVRAKLEELSGREFGYEPAALRAEARRIMEIQTSTNSAASTYPSTAETPIVEPEPVEPLESEVPKPQPHKSKAPSAEAVAGRVGGYEEPKNRESNPLSQLISERKNEAAKNEAAKKDVAGKDAPKKDAPAQEASTEAPHREEFPVVKAEEKKPEEKKPEEKKDDAKKDETVSYRGRRRAEDREPAHEQEEAGRRRRRSDENESGVSVAELMARMKAADKE